MEVKINNITFGFIRNKVKWSFIRILINNIIFIFITNKLKWNYIKTKINNIINSIFILSIKIS